MGDELRLFALLALHGDFLLYVHREGLVIDGHELSAEFLALHEYFDIMAEILLKLDRKSVV